RVVQSHLEAKNPLSIVFAIPDHPWVDGVDGADVRIAITVCSCQNECGVLNIVSEESKSDNSERNIQISPKIGKINSDLSVGVDFEKIVVLQANEKLCSMGVKLHGKGFILSKEEAISLGVEQTPDLSNYIKPFVNGRDLAQKPRGVYAIDFFGLSEAVVSDKFPKAYQWLLDNVKPERMVKAHTKDGAGYAKLWWIFGKPRQEMRKSLQGLNHLIATVRTAKHRTFQFLSKNIIPESKLVVISLEDPYQLGVLTSRLHVAWSFATGGWLGVGNDSTYNHSECFNKMPFPSANKDQKSHIRQLAEQLDTHRKQRQSEHPDLTLTGMYNVLEKLRLEEELTAKEKKIHEQGLVSILKEIHNELDRAVFNAYGWDDLADKLVGLPGATTPLSDKPDVQAEAEEEMLKRLVDLNAQRAAEEAQGHIRWLRPEFQAPEENAQTQSKLGLPKEEKTEVAVDAKTQLPWPKELQEQIRAVREVLQKSSMDGESVNAQFKGKSKKKVEAVHQVLSALKELGVVNCDENNTYSI
ncbi:MAG: class I SAM-dependent DNA methyltransferase, partial [Gammaproteobacteria bacterium]|nr:class I SAM-dependent DNA methyltransferase [Gammaproteobacteria bacterium]